MRRPRCFRCPLGRLGRCLLTACCSRGASRMRWAGTSGGARLALGHVAIASSPCLPPRCVGRPRPLRRLLAAGEAGGHQLQRCVTASGAPLFFCVSCGARAISKCVRLLLPCPRQAKTGTAGWDALRRLNAGHHPDYHDHRFERVSVAQRHRALARGSLSGSGSSFCIMRAAEGSRLDRLRLRIRAKEQASSASADHS